MTGHTDPLEKSKWIYPAKVELFSLINYYYLLEKPNFEWSTISLGHLFHDFHELQLNNLIVGWLPISWDIL